MRVVSVFLKDNFRYILGFVVVMILVFFVLQTQRASKYYNKYLMSEGDFQAKNTAYNDLKKKTDSEKEGLAKDRDKERKARKERDKEIKEIRTEGRKKDKALVEAKAKIKELTPDELTIKLNVRVPTEFSLLASGEFSLTRNGADRTLGIFMDGERCTEALSERDSKIEKLKENETSFNTDMTSLKKSLKKTEDLLDGPEGCNKARLAAIKSKENLKKSFDAMKLKQFFKGAGGVGLIVVILKVAGVI